MSIDTIDAPNAGEDVQTTANKKTKITVTAANTNPVTFSMTSNYENGGGSQKGDRLDFDKGAGAFTLVFSLVDNSGKNLAFYPTPSDAMWVAVGAVCPTGPGNGGGAITFNSVKDGKLTVDNANAIAQDLAFELRFSGNASGGCPPYVYDPVIGNKGDGNMEDEDREGDGRDDDDSGGD